MRFGARIVIPILVIIGAVALLASIAFDHLALRWFSKDLDIRTELLFNTIHERVTEHIERQNPDRLQKLLTQMSQDERLLAIGVCSVDGTLFVSTKEFPKTLPCQTSSPETPNISVLSDETRGLLHVASYSLLGLQRPAGFVIFVHDMAFVQKRAADSKKYLVFIFIALGLLISLTSVVVTRWSLRGWLSGVRMLLGEFSGDSKIAQPLPQELKPLEKDLRRVILELGKDRNLRDEIMMEWNPESLRNILHSALAGEEVLIVSNREPYIHNFVDGKVETQFPASGVVTALEPVMKACSGTWIAHGSGTADKEVVDAKDHIQVPVENPSYSLRRVWLTKEEENGYYYGFANEGLWPLCHFVHTRPIFRESDWEYYKSVNEKFADVIAQEAKTSNPVVLVQDYHFALIPQMIKKRIPNATVISFWHIPWPNPEAFGICPWRDEILKGMLGSDILGFHTRYHCNNFVDSVDRYLESRIDRESSTISVEGRLTAVNPYPISIDWGSIDHVGLEHISADKLELRKLLNVPATLKIGLGIDRMDYTKGIIERFVSFEKFLETNPDWIGKVSFVQIAAPTRTSIEQYQTFESNVRSHAHRINAKFGQATYKPIILKIEHHEQASLQKYYRGADFCYVSSLHDGMNLVAKEFLSARDDEQGVLILSQFTGAARELVQALIVNPYDIGQGARAVKAALNMSVEEQRDRMRTMRSLIREFNVYRWAGRMLLDAARLRSQSRFQNHDDNREEFASQ